MDRITKSLLDEFRGAQALAALPEPQLFEQFAGYCVVSELHDEEFNLSDIHVGGGGDLSQDCIAIFVNGVVVTTPDEVEDLLETNGYIKARFVFVQAKSGGNFTGEEIGGFFDGVERFFRDDPGVPVNEAVEALRSVMTKIYDNSVSFRQGRPVLQLFFVTTGKWVDDPELVAKIRDWKASLDALALFDTVDFTPMGAQEIQESYQRSKNSVTVEFVFTTKITLPDIAGVDEAHLGILPIAEYLTLITDASGEIRKQLFYDNIRDFQGHNAVNSEISKTLESDEGRERFSVLNNGVTLVARGLRITGNKFVVSDFQIVNGCQTSHVLFNSMRGIDSKLQVPVKVIATRDEEVIAAIITATNRQTQVNDEDLYALGAFQKQLESYFASYRDKQKLFYERRSKQYNAVVGVEKVRIISKTLLVRAFAAMFLDDPHRAARYYSALKPQIGTKIFGADHKLEPYYVAAYGYYKLEYLFRNASLPLRYKPARYHLLMAFRQIVGGVQPALTSNKTQKYCMDIANALWSDDKAIKYFGQAIAAVEVALAGDPCDRDVVKTQAFTDAVKAAAQH